MIETENLILKPAEVEDASFYLELMNMPSWLQFIGDRNVHSVQDAENYISKRMLPQIKELGYGSYTVIQKSNMEKIGTCGIYNRQGLEGVDLGFGFLPQYERRGFGFESSIKLIDLAFNQYGIKKLKAITNPNNLPSQKLLDKLGFSKVGVQQLEKDEIWVYELEKNVPTNH